MKRTLFILLVMLTGCSGAAQPASAPAEPAAVEPQAAAVEPAKVEASATEAPASSSLPHGRPEGFPFEYQGQSIFVGMPADPIVSALGEPLDYFEAPSCAFEGIDKTYFYNGIELHTFPMNESDYVLAVLFTDDSIETPKGVYIGASLESALSAYGDDYTQDGDLYVYKKDGGSLGFFAEDGIIAEVSYNYITGE